MTKPCVACPSAPEVGIARDLAYGAIGAVTAPLWLPVAVARGYHRTGWRGRFGAVSVPRPEAGPRVLLHGVSVGEVASLKELVPALSAKSFDCLISATTDTGLAQAKALFEGCPVVQFPFDLSGPVGRFLDATQPDIVALVELEVWPNFIEACAARDVPVVVISGRISERSAPRYNRLRPLLGRTFEQLTAVGAQTAEYATRFVQMGTPEGRVFVTDSLKWDQSPDETAPLQPVALAEALGIDPERPLVVAGSTGPGEETLLARSWPDDVQLLVAPRKPERFDEVAADLPSAVRRSTGSPTRSGNASSPRLFLLDSLGELGLAYGLANVAILGRSFNGMGGSNPIEPAACGCPVLVGPDHGNFTEVVERLRVAGGLEVAGRDDIVGRAVELARNGPAAKDMGERARAAVEGAQGATARTVALIERALAGPPGGYGA